MDIQVVLTQDDSKLGKRGEVVKVSSGFANNFLFPHNKAKLATPSNLKAFQDQKARTSREEAARRAEAESLAAKLNSLTLTLEMLTGEGDKLYGAVTAQDILTALAAQGISLEKRDLHLEEPIRKLGNYQVLVKPHPAVTTQLKIAVVKKK